MKDAISVLLRYKIVNNLRRMGISCTEKNFEFYFGHKHVRKNVSKSVPF